MQITINQSEIESAITTYINGLFGKLNPGTKIQIELKATRGAEGATAIIDLIPDSQAIIATPEPKKKEVAEVIHEIKATSAKLFQSPPMATEAAVAEEQLLAASGYTKVEAIKAVAETEPTSQATLQAQDVPARTSLFAGLKKPVNA